MLTSPPKYLDKSPTRVRQGPTLCFGGSVVLHTNMRSLFNDGTLKDRLIPPVLFTSARVEGSFWCLVDTRTSLVPGGYAMIQRANVPMLCARQILLRGQTSLDWAGRTHADCSPR